MKLWQLGIILASNTMTGYIITNDPFRSRVLLFVTLTWFIITTIALILKK